MPASLLFLRFSALLALVGAAAGCSDPPDLTIKGRSYTFTEECWSTFSPGSPQLAVHRFSGGQGCALSPKDGGMLEVTADAADASGTPILGNYPLAPDGGKGGVALLAFDSNCDVSTTESATASSGQVTLTDFVGGHLIGAYGVVFPTGEHTAAHFDAQSCSECPGLGTSTCF